MSKQIQAVRQLYADFSRGNADAVVRACSQDCCWTIPHFEESAADTYVGRCSIAEFVAGLLAQVHIEILAPEAILEDREWVVAVGRYSGTVRSTGQTFNKPWLHCWRLREESVVDADGLSYESVRIASFDDSYDTLAQHGGAVEVKTRAA